VERGRVGRSRDYGDGSFGLDSCSYGLAVTSDSDPVVAADGLPGTGAFASVGAPNSPCSADLAPTSGWTRVSATDLRRLGVASPPVAG
jgi:hypothetical protein